MWLGAVSPVEKSERGRGTESGLIFGEERFAEIFNRSDRVGKKSGLRDYQDSESTVLISLPPEQSGIENVYPFTVTIAF